MKAARSVAAGLTLFLVSCAGSEKPAPSPSSPPDTVAEAPADTEPAPPPDTVPPPTAPPVTAPDYSSVSLPSECEDLVSVRVAYVQARIERLRPNERLSPEDPEALRGSLRRDVVRDGYEKTADRCRQLADHHRARMPRDPSPE